MSHKPYTHKEIVLAHQYLYYVLARPIWDDYGYDLFCKQHGLNGIGGSDGASNYPQDIRDLAVHMQNNPEEFPSP